MTTVRTALLSMALGATACATSGTTTGTTTATAATASEGERLRLPDGTLLVCRWELPTGSHIREEICRPEKGTTPTEKEFNRQFIQPATKQTIGG